MTTKREKGQREWWMDGRLEEAVEELGSGRHETINDVLACLSSRWGRRVTSPRFYHWIVRVYGKTPGAFFRPPDHRHQGQIAAMPMPRAVREQVPDGGAVVDVRAELEALSGSLPPPDPAPPPRSDSAVTPILLVSDIHAGGHHRALMRLPELADRVYEAVAGRQVDEIVVCLLGDLVDGTLVHWEQVGYGGHALSQVTAAVEPLASCIRRLSGLAPVRVSAVPGNHGRSGSAAAAHDNWDHVAAEVLRVVLAPHGIPVDYGWTAQRVVTVRGRRGMIQHGKWGRIVAPLQVATPAARSRVLGWARVHSAEWMAWGHHHSWMAGQLCGLAVYRNGALCDGNGYSDELGVRSRPTQLLVVADDGPCTGWAVLPIEID